MKTNDFLARKTDRLFIYIYTYIYTRKNKNCIQRATHLIACSIVLGENLYNDEAQKKRTSNASKKIKSKQDLKQNDELKRINNT